MIDQTILFMTVLGAGTYAIGIVLGWIFATLFQIADELNTAEKRRAEQDDRY